MRTIYRLYYILRDFNWQMTKKNISAFAASTAFFLFLSMIPLLMALCAILPYTTLTEANLINAITQFTPDAVNGMVIRIVSDVYARSAGTITVFAIVTIWSAAKAMLALIYGLNAVNDVEEKRNYIVLRAIACFYTVIILAATLVALFVMVFGNVIVDILLRDIPPLHLVVHVIMRFRFLVSWVILTFVFPKESNLNLIEFFQSVACLNLTQRLRLDLFQFFFHAFFSFFWDFLYFNTKFIPSL